MTPQQVWILVGWLVVMAAIVAAALVLARRNERRLESAWREFAQRSGHDWIEAHGTWPNKHVFAVTGTIDGVSFKLDRYFVSTGKSRIPFTRVRGPLAHPLSEKVSVRRRNLANRLNGLFTVGQPAVEIGDTSFDAQMIVRSKSRDAALSLLDAEVRRALIAFPRALRIDAQESEVVVSWRAAERTPANLEAGCRLIALLCRKH
jgi:hypothetical protein